MIIYNSDYSTSFSLEIVGYEFPNIIDKYYDSNWLMVKVGVTTEDKKWFAIDPCVLTFEVDELIDWFENVKNESIQYQKIVFIEPFLKFERLEGDCSQLILRIYLSLKGLPTRKRPFEPQKEIVLEFDLNYLDEISIVNDLRIQLQKYPQRVFR